MEWNASMWVDTAQHLPARKRQRQISSRSHCKTDSSEIGFPAAGSARTGNPCDQPDPGSQRGKARRSPHRANGDTYRTGHSRTSWNLPGSKLQLADEAAPCALHLPASPLVAPRPRRWKGSGARNLLPSALCVSIKLLFRVASVHRVPVAA
jgi:hypothetical protein